MTSIIEQFHFIRPLWLLAIIPAIIIAIWLSHIIVRQSGWQQFIPNHLYQFMVEGKAVKRSAAIFWLLGLGWVLCILALAGPTWEKRPQPVFQVNRGHVIVIDMSMSMRSTDLSPNRLERAKYKAIDLINMLEGGETGLVAYAGDAFVISPLTADANNITTLLPSLSPEIMPVAGSDPYTGFEAAANLLKNAGYTQGDIFWITDGIDIEQSAELRDYVSALPYTINTLAVGTTEGAPIKQLDGELLKDRSGSIVIPKLDIDLIRAISRSSGGEFSLIRPDDRDIARLKDASSSITDKQKENSQSEQGDSWKEMGPYLLLLLLPFAAYSFRRGVLFTLAFAVCLSVAPTRTMANETANSSANSDISWWRKPFLNADQQASEHFENQQFHKAADVFKDASWKGSAHYRAGDYEQALKYFEQNDSADAFYNKGNALAQLGKFDDAIEAYDEALKRAPDLEDAQINKDLLEQLKQQQESQSNSSQDQNGEGDSDQNQQDQSSSEQQGQNDQQPSEGNNSEQSSEASNDNKDSSEEQNNGQQQSEGQNQENSDEPPTDNNESSTPKQQDKAQPEGEKEEQPQSMQSDEDERNANQTDTAAMSEQPMTDEQKEEMRRMDTLMKKVPDDPAFLLRRKMQLEAQQRDKQRRPSQRRDW